MEITELLTKDNLWIHYAPDLKIRTSLSNFGNEGQFRVDACIWYDMEKSDWVYEFESPGIMAMLGLKEQKDTIIAFLKAASIKQREDREKLIRDIRSSLSFTNDYVTADVPNNFFGDRKLLFKEAKIGETDIDLSLNLRRKKEINLVQILAPEGENDMASFVFSWEFAKKYFPGLKEFEEFLHTKSKDRLMFLF